MSAHPDAEAAAIALDALLGEDGRDAPAISSVSWLKGILDDIEGSPKIREILGGDDPESLIDAFRECRRLVDRGMLAVRMASDIPS